MKRFSRILAVLAAVVLTLSAFAVVSFAADKPALENDNIINNWDEDTVGRVFRNLNGNQTKGTLTPEGLLVEYTGAPEEGSDPYFTFPVSNYYKQFSNTIPLPENAGYWVFLVKASPECDGGFEVFTSQPAAFDSGTSDYYNDDQWQYILVDMSFTSLVDENKLTTIRIDWSATATLPGASMLIAEIAIFADEDAAYEYIDNGYEAMENPPTEAPTEEATEAPTEEITEAPTEIVTEAPAAETEAATDAPAADTEAEESGCGGMITVGCAVVVMVAAAAFVCKKH